MGVQGISTMMYCRRRHLLYACLTSSYLVNRICQWFANSLGWTVSIPRGFSLEIEFNKGFDVATSWWCALVQVFYWCRRRMFKFRNLNGCYIWGKLETQITMPLYANSSLFVYARRANRSHYFSWSILTHCWPAILCKKLTRDTGHFGKFNATEIAIKVSKMWKNMIHNIKFKQILHNAFVNTIIRV